MLLIKARVWKSPIHGFGLFADQDITKESMIWNFIPGLEVEIPEYCLSSLLPTEQEQIFHCACHETGKHRFILPSDDDRFLNYTDFPNGIQTGEVMYARQYSVCGEITCNYREVIMLNVRLREFPHSREER